MFYPERFAAKLGENLAYYNFLLKEYFKTDTVDFQETLEQTMQLAERIKPMVADVSRTLYELNKSGENPSCLKAPGAPCWTWTTAPIRLSPRPTVVARRRLCRRWRGPQMLNYVLGIVKAYTTRVGSGPFPTELFDDVGAGLAKRGNEFSAVTGRPRRCGWFDAALLGARSRSTACPACA